MTSVSYWTITKNGRLYPVKARTGPYGYSHEVWREGSRIRTRYLGVQRIPQNVSVVKKHRNVVKRKVRGAVQPEDNGHTHNGFVKIEGYQCVDCGGYICEEFLEEHRSTYCPALSPKKEVITV